MTCVVCGIDAAQSVTVCSMRVRAARRHAILM